MKKDIEKMINSGHISEKFGKIVGNFVVRLSAYHWDELSVSKAESGVDITLERGPFCFVMSFPDGDTDSEVVLYGPGVHETFLWASLVGNSSAKTLSLLMDSYDEGGEINKEQLYSNFEEVLFEE